MIIRTILSCFVALLLAFVLISNPIRSKEAYAATHQQKTAGRMIVVNLTQQRLYAFQNGREVFTTLILSGAPDLPTPPGTYHVFAKLSPTTFYSPWPKGSPHYYPPTHINFALEFLAGGYFLHDSWWHSVYGPGTNGWHKDPVYGWQEGSHGCVSMPYNAASWLYQWAPIGTTVQITA
jgi:lipoprotein-anchoring transpeptidase ErfK/SrfK